MADKGAAAQLRELTERLRNIDTEKEQARPGISEARARNEARIRDLHIEVRQKSAEFEKNRREQKKQLRAELLRAIKDVLREGGTQAEVLRIMQSTNTKLVSQLYKEVKKESGDTVALGTELEPVKESAGPQASTDSTSVQTSILAELRAERRRQGLTQMDVALRMGVSVSVFNKIERGSKGEVKLSTLERYAHALGMRILARVVSGERP